GGRQIEYLLAMLNGDDAPRRETLAVPRTVDFIDNGNLGIARPDEIGVQRMTDPFLHRAVSRHERLSDHLPAEHALPAHIGAVPAKQVFFDPLQIEQFDEIFDGLLVGLGRRLGHGLSWQRKTQGNEGSFRQVTTENLGLRGWRDHRTFYGRVDAAARSLISGK